MLKTTLKSIVALALTATSAAALDVTGTYRGAENGTPIAVELAGEGQVRGAFVANGIRLNLAGVEKNGQIQGVLHTPDGRQVLFSATRNGNGLVFQAAGGQVQLTLDNGTARNAPPVNVPQVNGPANMPANVRLAQGEVFAIPLPAGWQMSQSICECFSVSPDQSLAFGFIGLERIAVATPEQFLHSMLQLYKHGPATIHAAQPIRFEGATAAAEFRFSYRASNGRQMTAWARVAVTHYGGQMNAYMIVTSTAPEAFDANFPALKAMAEKIEIVNVQRAFDRDRALAIIKSIPNRPMDHSFTESYWKNSKRMDDVMKRGSDVRRDQYTWTDPVTGEKYHGGQNNIDPTKGGVPNPQRPTELLVPEPHWQKKQD
jgi:hypothetical protein